MLAVRRGDLPQAIGLLERALAGCRATDIVIYWHGVALRLGVAYALCGRIAEARPLFEQVMEQETGGIPEETPMLKGEGYLLIGNLEQASAFSEQALTLSRTHKARGTRPGRCGSSGDCAARQSSKRYTGRNALPASSGSG